MNLPLLPVSRLMDTKTPELTAAPLPEIIIEKVPDCTNQAQLKRKDFQQICQILYQSSGIRLNTGKEELVRSRLLKRLRALSIKGFGDYLGFVLQDKTGQELRTMIDCLTTNKTSFFRENKHFDYVRNRILPGIKESGGGICVWSAGCSSGEEPYSIAMLLTEELPGVQQSQIRILATDISETVLARARSGQYEKQNLKEIPHAFFTKYFSSVPGSSNQLFRVNDKIKSMVRFARLNLMDEWPMRGPFDVIFCRNVMIYFDNLTQKNLVRRFWQMLVPGGHLLVGHSESLVANSQGFRYIQPATYMKDGSLPTW